MMSSAAFAVHGDQKITVSMMLIVPIRSRIHSTFDSDQYPPAILRFCPRPPRFPLPPRPPCWARPPWCGPGGGPRPPPRIGGPRPPRPPRPRPTAGPHPGSSIGGNARGGGSLRGPPIGIGPRPPIGPGPLGPPAGGGPRLCMCGGSRPIGGGPFGKGGP